MKNVNVNYVYIYVIIPYHISVYKIYTALIREEDLRYNVNTNVHQSNIKVIAVHNHG